MHMNLQEMKRWRDGGPYRIAVAGVAFYVADATGADAGFPHVDNRLEIEYVVARLNCETAAHNQSAGTEG